MPTGVEYRNKLLALQQALGQWCEMDTRLNTTQPCHRDWSRVCQAHTVACRSLQAAYAAVMEDVMAEIEQQWGGETNEPQA